MKNSTLDGAANSAPVQSQNNHPSGSTKPSKGATGSRIKDVSISNTDSKPASNSGFGKPLN